MARRGYPVPVVCFICRTRRARSGKDTCQKCVDELGASAILADAGHNLRKVVRVFRRHGR